MKHFLTLAVLLFSLASVAQTQTDKIRQQMQQIRQNTNWDDPAAARKANEEIKRLAGQLNGGKAVFSFGNSSQQSTSSQKPLNVAVKTNLTAENMVAIADRFYQRSYKKLDAVSQNQFDIDQKEASKNNFNLTSVRKLASTGAALINFHGDDNLACVYAAAAVKAFPLDTLSINNFGAYLRLIDSTATSIPVLLYANKLFSQSPVVLTQLGNSYFELNDFAKAESFHKQALKVNPQFGQAHTSLCDLYISQNRLQDAILELFAGVKGMGASYSQASGNFSYLKSQAENSANGATDKEKFWDEVKNQINPDDALAPLVPTVNPIKMPKFPNCLKIADWMEGGGYAAAVGAYGRFHADLMSFGGEFQDIQKLTPMLPSNVILRDYPNERFALDCITEYFFHESKKEDNRYQEERDNIMKQVTEDAEIYMQKKEGLTKLFVSCCDECGTNQYCIQECHRKFCQGECPNAIDFNKKLQKGYDDFNKAFKKMVSNQEKILDDLYEFTPQWFSKIQSEYWSRIYAYEIQRVALSIIGNCYSAYPQAFIFPAHNDCGTDCSIYANPYPIPAGKVNKKKPEGNQCPNIGKLKVSLLACDLGLDCESIEFGCTAGIAGSVKRNFVKKTTTGFLGVGVKGGAGFISAGAKAGFEVTVTDNNEVEDVGAKYDVSVSLGPGVTKGGVSSTGSYTVMTGLKSKTGFSFGGKAK